jgi:signal transduction histidine kinase
MEGSVRHLAEWIRGALASWRSTERFIDDGCVPIDVLEDSRAAAILFVGSATEPAVVETLPFAGQKTGRRDEFLAKLSDELRIPLGSIQNAVHLLGSQAEDSSARRRTQALIERQVRRMTQLVDTFLGVSQGAS